MSVQDFDLSVIPPDDEYALSNAYYFMILSNRERIYQDDDNPLKAEKSTWKRLQRYLDATGLKISILVLKFRSHEVHIHVSEEDDCLYFCRAIGKDWDLPYEDHYFVVGKRVTPSRIENIWFKLPSLEIYKTVSKEIAEIDMSEKYLYFFKKLDAVTPA